MPKQEEEFQVNLKILSVDVTKFLIDESDFIDNEDFYNSLRTDVRNEYSSDFENDIINIKLTFDFYTINNEEKTIFIGIVVNYKFHVSPLDKLTYFEKNENGVKESKFNNNNILVTLLSIAYSTTRGILIEKLSNSNFKKKIFLPLVDPSNLIKNFK